MNQKPTYDFDVEGHTVVTPAEETVDAEPIWPWRVIAFTVGTALLMLSILFAVSWVYYTFFWSV